MTTPTTMNESQVIGQLNELIENCKDGAQGFRTCAGHARARELKQVLDERSEQCDEAALERCRYVLEWSLPADLRPLVERQYQGARRSHDQVKLLRERYRDAG